MTKSIALTWVAVVSIVATFALLVTLTLTLWLPDPATGLLLAGLFFLPAIATLALLKKRRDRPAPWHLSADTLAALSDADLVAHRLEAIADYERRLELRELRLARRLRTSQLADPAYIDLIQADPSDEELDALVRNDRKLLALIDQESQLVFNRILQNRYYADDGVNTGLILQDTRDFVEKVARLYRADSEDILLETEIELIAKSFSSASLHLLIVVDDLPLNLKSYSTAKMYRLIRRSVKYYGTYKAFRPYLEHGLNAFQLARLALGMNPVAVATTWVAGKLSTYGTKAVGERLLQRTALQLLNDFIRVIGFEAAMMYGGDFSHRDANWVFGAELVNLEISRGEDFAGRDAALQTLCRLVLRNEFDRIHFLTRMSRHKLIDVERLGPRIIMTQREREDIAARLAEHCRETAVDLHRPATERWKESLETALAVPFAPGSDDSSAESGAGSTGRRARLKERLRAIGRKSGSDPGKDPGDSQ